MSCQIRKLESGSGLQIWIDEDQPFRTDDLFAALAMDNSFRLIDKSCTHQSMGPLEKTEEIRTSHGDFFLEQVWEGYDHETGVSIYSKNRELMGFLYRQMVESGLFHPERKQTS